MSFTSGRATFIKFTVSGTAPDNLESVLEILSKNKFKEVEIGTPDEVETGWITGEHLLDTQFSYEKNGFGDTLLFAMRMDSHKVPSDLKMAYKKISEQAAAEGNPSGFASRAQKKDAAEEADRQVHDDLAAGKFRKSTIIPLLWDLPTNTLYCGAATNKATEHLASLFRNSFSCDLDILSAGTLAGKIFRDSGKGRDYEDLKPSAFTKPPVGRVDSDSEVDSDSLRDSSAPVIPWVLQSTDLKDFLGNEFLFFLWHRSETEEGRVPVAQEEDQTPSEIYIAFDKQLDMDCAWSLTGKQTLRGDGPTRLAEAGQALKSGKWPRKAGLLMSDGEHQWELSLQADKMVVSGAALPEIPDAQSARELTEGRLLLIKKLSRVLDGMYQIFLEQRTSGSWPTQRSAIAKWIQTRKGYNQ